MQELIFQVQGSAPEPYQVTFRWDVPHLSASCSCPAGQVGQYCKHRLAILRGDAEAVVSDNADQVQTVAGWLQGTRIEEALDGIAAAERHLAEAQRAVSAAKKRLAAAMRS